MYTRNTTRQQQSAAKKKEKVRVVEMKSTFLRIRAACLASGLV